MSHPDKRGVAPSRVVNSEPDERILEVRIAELAYFRAQSRGFEPGHDVDDWLEAEEELKRAVTPTPLEANASTAAPGAGSPSLASGERRT
jgi:hypothetical protein